MAQIKEQQKRLKEVFKKELEGYWKDKKMIDHCLKEANFIVELKDGSLITIDKPIIKKDFCFGYSLSQDDSRSFDNANKMAESAEKDVDYFLMRNLEDVDRKIKILTEEIEREYSDDNVIVYGAYTGQSKDSKLRGWAIEKVYHEYNYPGKRNLDQEEITMLKNGYKEVKKMFSKRLQTYLKRYGLSKVNAWTYWRDE